MVVFVVVAAVVVVAAAAAAVGSSVFESRNALWPFLLPALLRSFLFSIVVTVGALLGDGERRVAWLYLGLGRWREKGREGRRLGGREKSGS